MRQRLTLAAGLALGIFATSTAQAACTGTLGRGWASGRGQGAFEMTSRDRSCSIDFPAFINDRTGKTVPATRVTISKAPSAGTLKATRRGLIYRPQRGFTGSDSFCISNTTPKVPGETLSGCTTITVR
jgi:hypothetical protein